MLLVAVGLFGYGLGSWSTQNGGNFMAVARAQSAREQCTVDSIMLSELQKRINERNGGGYVLRSMVYDASNPGWFVLVTCR